MIRADEVVMDGGQLRLQLNSVENKRDHIQLHKNLLRTQFGRDWLDSPRGVEWLKQGQQTPTSPEAMYGMHWS